MKYNIVQEKKKNKKNLFCLLTDFPIGNNPRLSKENLEPICFPERAIT